MILVYEIIARPIAEIHTILMDYCYFPSVSLPIMSCWNVDGRCIISLFGLCFANDKDSRDSSLVSVFDVATPSEAVSV